MKLYKKQIRPMISPPAIPGINCSDYSLEEYICGEEIWYDEDYVVSPEEKDIWEKQVLQYGGPSAKLVFQERYVPITSKDAVKHVAFFFFFYTPIGEFYDNLGTGGYND